MVRRDLESKATKEDLSDLGKAIRTEMATKADLADLDRKVDAGFFRMAKEIVNPGGTS